MIEADEWVPAPHALKRSPVDLPWDSTEEQNPHQARIDAIDAPLSKIRKNMERYGKMAIKLDEERRELLNLHVHPDLDADTAAEDNDEEAEDGDADQIDDTDDEVEDEDADAVEESSAYEDDEITNSD